MEFANLHTVKMVQMPLKPAALRIYRSVFPNSRVEDLREHGVKVHVLDKEFGIDSLLHMPSGQWFSIQEKYRDYPKWKFHDYTMEIENGDGTPGEWFKLGAQMYFYGWGDPEKRVFLEWFILDVSTMKLIIERKGGIREIGSQQQNQLHGRSKFIGIPYDVIKPAITHCGTGNVFFTRLSDAQFSAPRLIR